MSRLPRLEKNDHPKGKKTPLDEVLPLVLTTLSGMLRPDDDWKKWTNVLRDYDGKPKYLLADVR